MSAPTGRRYRLAIVASHPIQYHAPLYRALAVQPEIDLTVFFCSRAGLQEYRDPEFGQVVRWDRPLLDGYAHRFVRNLSPAPAPGRLLGLINPGLLPALWRGRFDAVLIPGYAVASYWIAYAAALSSGSPVLFRGETALRPGRGRLARLFRSLVLRPFFRGTAACLTIGRRSHEFYLHYGVPEQRLFFTPYTVDNEFFAAESQRLASQRGVLRGELGLPRDLPVLLFVGKLVPRKRPCDLIEALAGLERPAALLLVGDGPLRPKLESRVRQLGLRNVTFAGFRNQSELPRFYAAADVLALPSSHEVAPLVLNEAMCSGLALVVSDAVPSAADLVEEGLNGHLHACGNVVDLTRALDAAIVSPENLRRFGRRSREKIAEWSHARVAVGLLAALRACARRPPVGGNEG